MVQGITFDFVLLLLLLLLFLGEGGVLGVLDFGGFGVLVFWVS